VVLHATVVTIVTSIVIINIIVIIIVFNEFSVVEGRRRLCGFTAVEKTKKGKNLIVSKNTLERNEQ
jgi:hypothetical protein